MRERSVHTFAQRWWRGELGTTGHMLRVLLAPATGLYRLGVALRNAAYNTGVFDIARAPVPVVSVGNIAVGGTGKTPFAQYIARLLFERGCSPAIVHGGYADDEPALHRHWSGDIPVYVDRMRIRAAQTAAARGADVVVLDDGFQHRRLHRDLDIVLVSAERWHTSRSALPRGPLREPRSALRRAQLVVVTRKTASAADAMAVQRAVAAFARTPVAIAHLVPTGWLHEAAPAPPPDRAALAVVALAEPDLFVDNAQRAGARVHSRREFADHYAYSHADADDILKRAGTGPIVTTEKDWMKLQFLLPQSRVWRLTQRVHIEAGIDALHACLDDILRQLQQPALDDGAS